MKTKFPFIVVEENSKNPDEWEEVSFCEDGEECKEIILSIVKKKPRPQFTIYRRIF